MGVNAHVGARNADLKQTSGLGTQRVSKCLKPIYMQKVTYKKNSNKKYQVRLKFYRINQSK